MIYSKRHAVFALAINAAVNIAHAQTVIERNPVEWTVTTEASKIDDSENVLASIAADYPAYDRFGRPKHFSFHVTCREGRTDVFIVFDDLFMSSHQSYGDVTLRIDKEKARVVQMFESTDHKALGLWRGNGIRLLKSMVGKSKLLVVATPYSESSVDTTFSLQGFDKAIAEVRRACRW